MEVLLVTDLNAISLLSKFLHKVHENNHVTKRTVKYHVTRLDEDTANRKNNNRLFDSQNNNKGGYNTGDRFTSEGGSRPERFYSMVSVLINMRCHDFRQESAVFLSYIRETFNYWEFRPINMKKVVERYEHLLVFPQKYHEHRIMFRPKLCIETSLEI